MSIEIGLNRPGAVYEDSRGWKYRVMGGMRSACFKLGYQKPGQKWRRSRGPSGQRWHTEWFETFDEAEAILKSLAAKNGWTLLENGGEQVENC